MPQRRVEGAAADRRERGTLSRPTLEGEAGGIRFLLRSDAGELLGVYGRNAQSALSAAPLVLKLTVDNPFRGLDFFETPEGLLVRG
jgi:hypothetical protein